MNLSTKTEGKEFHTPRDCEKDCNSPSFLVEANYMKKSSLKSQKPNKAFQNRSNLGGWPHKNTTKVHDKPAWKMNPSMGIKTFVTSHKHIKLFNSQSSSVS